MNLHGKAIFVIATILSGCGAAVVADMPVSETTLAPASPGPAYVWIGDSWSWDRSSNVYVMRPGYWTEPKRKNATWIEGRWIKTRRGWKYIDGHWRNN